MKLTGAQALIKSLETENVEVIFGIPGGAILPVYDPLIESPIRHILVRHEQGAGHMAEGYATVTGRPGVAMVTSGPAATNIVTPLLDAFMDSIPIVVITGQVGSTAIGTDAFQEADTVGITIPVTKHNYLVTSAEEIPRIVAEAFHIATTGRPGPVLIDVPKDISTDMMDWYWPESIDLPGYKPSTKGHPKQARSAAEMINSSSRPVIYAGGGVLKSRATDALRDLAELIQAPVVTTLKGRGAFPDSHPLALGMPGMHGTYSAVTAMQRCDLLITLGARFDDRVTGRLDGFAPHAKVVHVDIDPAELGKVRKPDIPIVGDVRIVTESIIEALLKVRQTNTPGDTNAWLEEVDTWKRDYPLAYNQEPDGPLKAQYCVERLCAQSPEDTIVVTGVGQHQMFTSQYWKFNHPHSFVSSGGLGTMGYAVPSCIGAKVGRPDKTVWAIDGDGSFQMTAQELVTAAAEGIPVKVAILNNAYLGMVRQWQEMFYQERYSEVYLSPDLPDYSMWAEAMGCVGFRVDNVDDVGPTIDKANSIDDKPVVIDFRVDYREKVYPMVPAGKTNDDIMLGPDVENK